MDSQSQNSQIASSSCEVRSLPDVVNLLLNLVPGAGHNMMNERSPDAKASELSDLQTIEDKLGEEADKLGLKLYIAQSNVEGGSRCYITLILADFCTCRLPHKSHTRRPPILIPDLFTRRVSQCTCDKTTD